MCPERRDVQPGQARLAWRALFISASDVQFLSDIKYPSLECLSLSFFGHTIIFHESPFLFDLILRTLLPGARVEEGKEMETFQASSLVVEDRDRIL